MPDFKNKVVLITGGTSGIGLETARKFAQEGAKVVISGRSNEKGEAAELMLKEEGFSVNFVQADSSLDQDTKRLINTVVSLHGQLDIAFNNAAIGGEIAPLHQQKEGDWDDVINVNLKGVWLSMKYQLQQFLKQDKPSGCSIVNMSSVWGVGASDFGVSPYIAAKHGVIGLTEAAALEYAKYNIRVNSICPGWVHTGANDAVLQNEDFRRDISKHHPLNRLGQCEEIASAVLWLSTVGAGFVTGHSLVIDGGISARR
ncbi:MAG: NAD(P)-dependent dehydrogenase (short-subunit alcohol dehydrogenase family) [Flavobacteriales bacterium]|jgi:NAD(P)-dependent dehydrogenase (short-subunit alcohol dehydrogenase family)